MKKAAIFCALLLQACFAWAGGLPAGEPGSFVFTDRGFFADKPVTVYYYKARSAGSDLRIDSGTTVLSEAMITDMDHCYDRIGVSVIHQPIDIRTTHIGPNCFIGSGAKVLAGTTLGAHCVIGANAVVRGRFPPGSVIAGNPARIVRQYDEDAKTWRKPAHPRGGAEGSP